MTEENKEEIIEVTKLTEFQNEHEMKKLIEALPDDQVAKMFEEYLDITEKFTKKMKIFAYIATVAYFLIAVADAFVGVSGPFGLMSVILLGFSFWFVHMGMKEIQRIKDCKLTQESIDLARNAVKKLKESNDS